MSCRNENDEDCSHDLYQHIFGDIQYREMDADMGVAPNDDDDDALPSDEHEGFALDPQMTPQRKIEKEMERARRTQEHNRRSQPKDVWCRCHNCIELTPLENICCIEDSYIEKIIKDEKIQCITEHEGFVPTTLNVHVLDTVKMTLLKFVEEDYKKEKLRASNNDTYRFLAYYNFRKWVSKGEKLGKGRRLQTPPCVVKLIRAKWPSENNTYKGFVSTLNSVDDL